ncbi:auxilin-like protein 1 [Vigna umbellata]|uniref:auxilin-like protein 1 n=1 Tax=Vigna umbellata TaxID=87088 RepID=UPI001F5ED496|nr:auxilin-like protein 1 [Vigna umbellata]
MEFGTAAATLTKKLSNGYGVSGRSAYDGVFAAPIKLRAPTFSSQFEDYREIFGAAGASLGSSIPILELPELNESKKKIDDVGRSRVDYSTVFGGFGSLDAAVPFEEIVAEPVEKDSFAIRSKIKGENQSFQQELNTCSKEIPVKSWSSHDAKKVNMSYHKVNQGSENGTGGTTHIAQLQAVPAYTRLIEEVKPMKINRANKSIPVAQDTYSGSHVEEGIKEAAHSTNSYTSASPDNSKQQSSTNNGVKVKNRSGSIDLFFDACEISNGNNGTNNVKVPRSETTESNLNKQKGDALKSTPIKFQASKSSSSEGVAGADSPPYSDEVAASVAALRKAMEEAQARMKVAKELMRRKKEGFPDRVKRKSNIEVKADGKRDAKVTLRTTKLDAKLTLREKDTSLNSSSEVGRSTMRIEKARPDLGTKETSEMVRELLGLEENMKRRFMQTMKRSAYVELVRETNIGVKTEPREAEKNITEELKGSENKVDLFSELEECELAEILEPLDNEIQDTEHSCQREAREATGNTFGSIYVQEEIVDHIHSKNKKSKLDGNDMVLDAQASENGFQEATQLMDGNTRERIDNKEPVEVIRVTLSDPCCEEVKAEKAGNTTETSSSYEPDETEKLNKTQGADIITENEETLEVNLKVHSYDEVDGVSEASSASFQQERYEETDPVQETSDFRDKHTDETHSFTQVAVELNEADNQIQNIFERETSEGAATNSGDTDIKARQNIDQCWEKKDAKETRDALKEDLDENRSNSSNGEILYDNEDIIDESQIPSTSDWKSSPFKEVEKVDSSHINIRESNQVSAMEEKGANDNLHKEEQEKEHLKKLDAAKEREREREKEKLAVERAIREARERAFADARERAAVERAAAEARQKNISDGRERLGKTNSQANEKTPAEKAALEAKLKTERAAVERATAEARARALERALSERAASDARNKSDKPVAGFVASRDNAMKQNFQSKSFSHGVRDSTDVFDGANGDSAQRCKARFERHQRIGERVAHALAEKNMRDRLVQKEQEERNRVAEILDADVKRWSSGKTGNLRALLSTLQYILGPDSGWQPIPLTDVVTTPAVKKAYRKATLFVHPDKLQQRGASIQQKYICEKVFDLLKEAWNRFNMEER